MRPHSWLQLQGFVLKIRGSFDLVTSVIHCYYRAVHRGLSGSCCWMLVQGPPTLSPLWWWLPSLSHGQARVGEGSMSTCM